MERIKTGIADLDNILHGGFPPASICVLAGGPGTGKTVLSQEIAFSRAAAGDKVLYFTTVSEPLHKLLRHVQDLSYCDPALIGTKVIYEDLGIHLQKASVEEVLGLLAETVRREAPKLVFVDSFKGLADLASDEAAFRRALYRLAGELGATGCAAFLLGEYSSAEIATRPEFAIADTIIELTNERRGIRTYRYLNIAKLRGSDFQDGQHAFQITKSGLQIYPRFRTPPTPREYESSTAMLPTGIEGLDRSLDGGYRAGNATLVVGPTGTGKTLAGMSFARAAAARGEKVVLTSFQEDPNQLMLIAANFGWDLRKDVDAGLVELLYVSPVELDLDRHVLRIVEAIDRLHAQILVVDSVSDLEKSAYDADRFGAYMFSLIQYAKDRSLSMFMTLEANQEFGESPFTRSGVSRIADTVLFFSDSRRGDQVRRELRILKTRGYAHDHGVHVVTIGGEGMSVTSLSGKP